jgi:acyl-CoA thioester hydrolase
MTVTLRIEPRWTDMDPAGHVNNSVYLVYAEEARARYLRAALPKAWDSLVVVNNSIDYHSPVEEDEKLDITSGVESVGTSSCKTISVISTTEGRKCATVRTVQAVLREDRKGTRPWTDAERASLEAVAE